MKLFELLNAFQALIAEGKVSPEDSVGYWVCDQWEEVSRLEVRKIGTGSCVCGHGALRHGFSLALKTQVAESGRCADCKCEKFQRGELRIVQL